MEPSERKSLIKCMKFQAKDNCTAVAEPLNLEHYIPITVTTNPIGPFSCHVVAAGDDGVKLITNGAHLVLLF